MAFLTTSILDSLNKDFIGAKQFTNALNEFYENRSQTSSFPPYDIIERADGAGYAIKLAVAGYDKSEITIKHDDNNLFVVGVKTEQQTDDVYIHRGIAARNFERKFLLKENIKITGAKYDNGILTIDMVRIEPEKEKSKMILIS